MQLIETKYDDFGPTLASEKLLEYHQINLHRDTVRKWMIEGEQWKVRKHRGLRVHQQRQRRSQLGELVQIDGSPHPWFEDRGEPCTLLVFIDDASGRLQSLHFEPTETTLGYYRALRKYIHQHGIPLAFYSDKHGIFRVNKKEAQSGSGETQFGRAVRELGIQLFCAGTPQAKGRVEKANRTLQDRLVKEMRLRGISDIESANAYLPEFMKAYHEKFAVEPANPIDAHLHETPSDEVLDLILTVKETRRISKNLEVSYQNKLYQIQTNQPCYTMRHAAITVCDDLQGNVSLLYKHRLLPYKVLDKRNQQQEVLDPKALDHALRKPSKPSKNHPWRQYEKVALYKKHQARQTKLSATF